MGKNKKKKFQKHTAPPKPKSEVHELMYKVTKNKEITIIWRMCHPDLNKTLINPEGSVFSTNEIQKSCLYNKLQNKLQQRLNKPDVNPTDAIATYKQEVESYRDLIHAQFRRWLKTTAQLNQTMNIYDPDVDTSKIDTINFAEFGDDVIEAANKALNDGSIQTDVSALWLFNQFVDIHMSPALMYRIERIMYDPLNIAVRYCITEYTKLKITDDITITIPMMSVVITADIINVKNKETAYAATERTTSVQGYKKDPEDSRIFDALAKNAPDENDFYAVRFGIMGADGLASIIGHLSDHHKHLSNTEYKKLSAMLKEISVNDMPDLQDSNTHMDKVCSVLLASIITTNKLLKEKRLSKPVKSPQNTIYKSEIILENKPERKIRVLADSITITSGTRPVAPDMDKIIKYHTPEWQRQSHLRRLKSGKIVQVKASKCVRKCVDMHGAKSNLPRQAVDYKIQRNEVVPNGDQNN